jgi:hypothetical protein
MVLTFRNPQNDLSDALRLENRRRTMDTTDLLARLDKETLDELARLTAHTLKEALTNRPLSEKVEAAAILLGAGRKDT